jgi:hypothetical protein
MPDEQFMRVLEKERGKGRDDYPIRAVWNALLAGIIFQHDSDAKLLRELARNGQSRSLCGFNGNVPTPWAFSRCLHKVLKHQSEVEEMFEDLVRNSKKYYQILRNVWL